jgi:hypothetical protein
VSVPIKDPRADSAVERVFKALDEARLLHGWLDRIIERDTVTVNLVYASESQWNAEATSFTGERVVALRLDDAATWNEHRLQRVLSHELAHIGLRAALGNGRLSRWIEEGFAEVLAGGLTCEGEVRIRLDVLRRRRNGLDLPAVGAPPGAQLSRLDYDYATTYVAYLDDTEDTSITDGGTLENGEMARILRLARENSRETADGWHRRLLGQYDGMPVPCPQTDRTTTG